MTLFSAAIELMPYTKKKKDNNHLPCFPRKPQTLHTTVIIKYLGGRNSERTDYQITINLKDKLVSS